MKAYRSNLEKESCSPVSSNCVTWQGPDLPCLNLCKGDSVSDVVYKVAVEICNLKDNIGLTDIDLTCLLEVCNATPEPTKTLANILELLISKVCCLSDIVDNIPPPGSNYVEPTLTLSPCLRYSNGSGGNVTELILSQYVLRIATFLCAVNTTVNGHTGDINQLKSDVYALQHPTIVTPVYSSCLLGSVETIPTIVQNLESEFCDYVEVLGAPTEINTSIAKQCPNLNDQKLLSTGAYITSLGSSNWKTSPNSLADSIVNLWAMVCDLRGSVKSILANCCKVDCKSITIDFDYRWVDSVTLKMYFTPKSSLPIGFYDCDDVHGNVMDVTDGLGNTWQAYFHFRRKDSADHTGILDDTSIMQNGYTLDFSNANAIDTSAGLTFSGNLCFTNDETSCINCVTKSVVGYVNKDCCTITAQQATTITYKVCLTPTTTTTTANPAP